MSEIPRYDPFLLGDSKLIEESANGEYVLYADHLKELEALRDQRNFLDDRLQGRERELDALRAQLRSKDEQLAGMRAAPRLDEVLGEFIAYMRVGGPDLDAVEAKLEAYRAALSGPSPAQEGTPQTATSQG